MNTIEAKEQFYFSKDEFPIAVRMINSKGGLSHEHDLTSLAHSHKFSELIIVRRGYGVHIINNIEYEISAGDVFLIQNESIVHYFRERHSLELLNVMFDVSKLPIPIDFLKRLAGYNILFSANELDKKGNYLKISLDNLGQVGNIFDQLSNELMLASSGYELGAYQKLLELIIYISRCYDQEHLDSNINSIRVKKVLNKIDSDYAKHWKLKDFAKIAVVSPNTLLRIFKQIMKCSPMEYLNKVRLDKAAVFLENSNKTIYEVAESCGFTDSNYFSKCFNKMYGSSPREFRKKTIELP